MNIDWTLLRSFAAVGEHGSLSAAARATGISQPTLSRHLSALEQIIGARVVERSARGVIFTPEGTALLTHAQDMARSAERLAMGLAGRDQSLTGTVRVTASEVMSAFVLPDLLTDLREAEPGITVELSASDRTENLLRRDADIAVRMVRPTQEDVIARRIGEVGMGVYAAPSYLARRGGIEGPEDLLRHDVIGFDRSDLILQGFRQMGLAVTRDFFAFRSDNQIVCWTMCRAGLGVAFTQRQIGRVDPDVVELADLGDLVSLPIWLVAHAELHASPRVRRVYDHLAAGLSAYVKAAG